MTFDSICEFFANPVELRGLKLHAGRPAGETITTTKIECAKSANLSTPSKRKMSAPSSPVKRVVKVKRSTTASPAAAPAGAPMLTPETSDVIPENLVLAASTPTSEATLTACAPEIFTELEALLPVPEAPEPSAAPETTAAPRNELVIQLPPIIVTKETFLQWRQIPRSTIECVRLASPEDRWAMFVAEMEAPENLLDYLQMELPRPNEGILQRCCGAMAQRWAETHPEFKAALRDEENLRLKEENQRLREEAQRNLSIRAPAPVTVTRTKSGSGKCKTDEQIHIWLKEKRIKDRLGITKKPTPEQREQITAELAKERENTPEELAKKKALMAKERVYSQRSYAKNGKKKKTTKPAEGGGGQTESESEEEEHDE